MASLNENEILLAEIYDNESHEAVAYGMDGTGKCQKHIIRKNEEDNTYYEKISIEDNQEQAAEAVLSAKNTKDDISEFLKCYVWNMNHLGIRHKWRFEYDRMCSEFAGAVEIGTRQEFSENVLKYHTLVITQNDGCFIKHLCIELDTRKRTEEIELLSFNCGVRWLFENQQEDNFVYEAEFWKFYFNGRFEINRSMSKNNMI